MDCGIAGIFLKRPLSAYPLGGAVQYMYQMLVAQQHRGQQGAGFASFSADREYSKLDVHKGLGLVNQVFHSHDPGVFRTLLERYAGTVAIGHVRYATSGAQNGQEHRLLEEAQPFHRRHARVVKHFAFAWNGNLANYPELKQELERSGEHQLDTPVDTEALMHYLSLGIRDEVERGGTVSQFNLKRVLQETTRHFDGSYNVGLINGVGELVAFRDAHGFMPLTWGENDDILAFASETKALNKIGIFDHRDFPPGHYLRISSRGAVTFSAYAESTPTPCFFQWLYFAHPMSVIDGVKVKDFREKIAEALVQEEPYRHQINDSWIVVPVPETSVPVGRRMAALLGIPCADDALIKDQAIRAFIEKPEQRDHFLTVKFNLDPEPLRGKHILLVDDSIVRGDTSHRLVRYIRDAADPASTHFRSAGPPIINPCFYGVDFPTRRELIASHYTPSLLEQQLAEKMEVQSLHYLSLSALQTILESFGKSKACIACLTGDYPTPAGKKRLEELI